MKTKHWIALLLSLIFLISLIQQNKVQPDNVLQKNVVSFSNEDSLFAITSTLTETVMATTNSDIATAEPLLTETPRFTSGECVDKYNGYCLYWENIYEEMNVSTDILANAKLMSEESYPIDAKLTTASERASAFLAMAERHKDKLPDLPVYEHERAKVTSDKFPIQVYLAMAYAESGDNYEWNNEVNSGGMMQIEEKSGFQKRGNYTNTIRGIENNVLDSIDALNFFFNNTYRINLSNNQFQYLHNMVYETFYGNHQKIAFTVLIYNGGFDPLRTYGSGQGNWGYLGSVAYKLRYDVPVLFGEEYYSVEMLEIAADIDTVQQALKH